MKTQAEISADAESNLIFPRFYWIYGTRNFILKTNRIKNSFFTYLLLICKGGLFLNYTVEDRAAELGEYIVRNNATVRAAAKVFGISKSTVHTDVSERLKKSDYSLYLKVRKVLDENKAQRHIRGGLATKEKYEHLKNGEISEA